MSGISGINRINTTSPYLYGHIASGNRLMSAANGASELAVTEKMKAQVTGYNIGTKNLGAGSNLLNTSDSALGSITDSLQRIRELALRASNTATMNNSNRAEIQKEINQLKQGIEQTATQSTYNGIHVLNGNQSNGIQLVTSGDGTSITVNNSVNSTLEALGIADFDITKNFDLQAIDDAISKVSGNRSTLGAQSNALEHAVNYNDYASVNLTSSQSRMGDTDIAKKVQELTHQQTLQNISLMLQKRKMEQQGQKTSGLFLFQ